MSQRLFNQFRLSLEKDVVDLYVRVTFGSSGAPTLDASINKGIVSVTRNSAGKFTFVFGAKNAANGNKLDTYYKLLNVDATADTTGISGVAPAWSQMYLAANSTATLGTSSAQVVLLSGATATDPASGEAVYFQFTFRNSAAL